MEIRPDADTICLDVAIDHRIRYLFKPVPDPGSDPGNGTHVALLNEYGRSLKLPEAEIQVTTELAGPVSSSGLAVTLQQPREDHPFSKGTGDVIKDCNTLATLDALFRTASCGTLDLQRDVSVIDLLPYTSESRMKEMKTEQRSALFEKSTQIINGKQTAVMLCAAKIWDTDAHPPKGELQRFEIIGIGKTFRDTPLRLSGTKRINAFHPSFAVNRHRTKSILRQLLILEVTHTCGAYRSDWEEEDWMNEVRCLCSDLSRELSGFSKVPVPVSPGYTAKSIQDIALYINTYIKTIQEIETRIITPPMDGALLPRVAKRDIYDEVLELGIGKLCNDASLVLREVYRIDTKDRLLASEKKQQVDMAKASKATVGLAKLPLEKSCSCLRFAKMNKLIATSIKAVNDSVVNDVKPSGEETSLDLPLAIKAYLRFAEKWELLLGDLRREKWAKKASVPCHFEIREITHSLSHVTLAS